MKKVLVPALALSALLGFLYIHAAAAPYPTGVGGTGTSASPAAGQVLIGTGSSTYTPAYILCAGTCSASSASGTITITGTGVATDTGNWAGTWQLFNPSDFLSSSTEKVVSVNGLSGVVTISSSSLGVVWPTVNGNKAANYNIVPGTGVTSTVSGATTTISVSLNNGSAVSCSANQFLNTISATGTAVCGSVSFPTIPTYTFSAGTGISISQATSSTNTTTTIANTGVVSVQSSSQIMASAATGNNIQFSLVQTYLTAAIQALNGATSSNQTIVGTSGQINVNTVAGATNSTTTLSLAQAYLTAAIQTLAGISTSSISVNGGTGIAVSTSSNTLTLTNTGVTSFNGAGCVTAGNSTGTVSLSVTCLSQNQSITFAITGDATGTATGTTTITDNIVVNGLDGHSLPGVATGTLQYTSGAWKINVATSSIGVYDANGNLSSFLGSSCSGGQYVTGISATGTVACGTPSSGSGSGNVSTASSSVAANDVPYFTTSASSTVSPTSSLQLAQSEIIINGTTNALIFGSASTSYILNFNTVIEFPTASSLATYGCYGSSTITDVFGCLQYIYNQASTSLEIDMPSSVYTGSKNFSALTADKNVLIKAIAAGGTQLNETATSGIALQFGSGSASHTGDGIWGIYVNGPNSGTGTGISVSSTNSNAGEGWIMRDSYVTHFYENMEWGNNVYLIEMDHSYDRFNYTNSSGGGLLLMNGSTNAGETIGIGDGSLFSDGQPAANAVEIQTSGETNVEMTAPCSIDDAQLDINQYGGQGNNVHVSCHLEDPAADSIAAYVPIVMNSGNPLLNDAVTLVNATIQNDATVSVPSCDISLYGQLVISAVGIDNNGGTPPADVVCLGETSDTIYSSGITVGNNGNGTTPYLYNSVPLVGGIQTYNVTSTFAGNVQVSGILTDGAGNKYVTSTASAVTSFNSQTGATVYSVTCSSGCTAVTSTTSTAITVTGGGTGLASTTPWIAKNIVVASGTGIATISTDTLLSYIPFLMPQILGTSTVTQYYFAGYSNGVAATNSVNATGTLYALPIYIAQDAHVANIEADCEGQCNGRVEMGIYNTVNGLPGNLTLDAGNVSTTLGTFRIGGLSTQVYPGQYWLVIDYNTTSTIKSYTTNSLIPIGGVAAISPSTPNYGMWTASLAYGALPASFPTSSLTLVAGPPFPIVGIQLNP